MGKSAKPIWHGGKACLGATLEQKMKTRVETRLSWRNENSGQCLLRRANHAGRSEPFAFSGRIGFPMPLVNKGIGLCKKAAALANAELGVLPKDISKAICAACDELLAGKLHDQFPVDTIQGGAGTSTNMNANEVIANRALEIMGHEKGDYQYCHPNNHVNCSQSTNDAYPTAFRLALYADLTNLMGHMRYIQDCVALRTKAWNFPMW